MKFLEAIRDLDRRWIFTLMTFAVAIPLLMKLKFPEKSSEASKAAFEEIERLPEGSKVLLAWDYDPSGDAELAPMAKSFIYHCAKKKLKMYFLSIYPQGQRMAEDDIQETLKIDFPELNYGEDYVNLGYKPGYEGVIKVITSNLRALYTTDARGTNIDLIPMCKQIKTIRDMDLIINVSAGYPGTKEWVQYAASAYPKDFHMIAGNTGVQAAQMFPYYPKQLHGLLGAIKGAAEYEQMVNTKYGGTDQRDVYNEGMRRMGPQMVAHLLIIGFIILGNVIYFVCPPKT
jgi:hypothetical protein